LGAAAVAGAAGLGAGLGGAVNGNGAILNAAGLGGALGNGAAGLGGYYGNGQGNGWGGAANANMANGLGARGDLGGMGAGCVGPGCPPGSALGGCVGPGCPPGGSLSGCVGPGCPPGGLLGTTPDEMLRNGAAAALGLNPADLYSSNGAIDPVTGAFRPSPLHAKTAGNMIRQAERNAALAANKLGNSKFHNGIAGALGSGVNEHPAVLGGADADPGIGGGKLSGLGRHALNDINRQIAAALGNSSLSGGLGPDNVGRPGGAASPTANIRENAEIKAKQRDQAALNQALAEKMGVPLTGNLSEGQKQKLRDEMDAEQQKIEMMAEEDRRLAQEALSRNDVAKAAALEEAANVLEDVGKAKINALASTLKPITHHQEDNVFIGNEKRAERQREKALEAERLRAMASIAKAANAENIANALTAQAAVEAAEGRAEGALGKKLSKINYNKKNQVIMTPMDSIEDANLKESIALQDNMQAIVEKNDVLSKDVENTLQDMGLKNKQGTHAKADAEAGHVVARETPAALMEAIAVNDAVNALMPPPDINQALLAANADEIALEMMRKEIARMAEEEKAKILAEEAAKPVQAQNPEDALGVKETIPEDADEIDLTDASIKLPLKSFVPEVAKTRPEKEALEAQNRLRDDLRGKVTANKFDSPLNTVETGDGFLNIPESAKNIQVDDGLAYFTEDARDEMITNGMPTDSLAHKINTGERKDMAAGMGYFVADLSGLKFDLPSPTSKVKLVAQDDHKIIDLSRATGIDIKKGKINMVPWSEYKRRIRPKVNLAIVKEFPSVRVVKKTEKINRSLQEAAKILSEDKEMLKRVRDTKKKIIVNPDGKTFIELTPAFGVTERVPIDEIQRKIPSTYLSSKKGIKYGQDGIEELTGETKRRKYDDNEVVGNEVISNDANNHQNTLESTLKDERLKSIITPVNAFTKSLDPNKINYLKEIKVVPPSDVREKFKDIEKDYDIPLKSNEGDITAPKKKELQEKHKNQQKQKKEKIKKQSREEGHQDDNETSYKANIMEFIFKKPDAAKSSNAEVEKMIEEYTNTKIENLPDFKNEHGGDNYNENKKLFIEKIKEKGLQSLEENMETLVETKAKFPAKLKYEYLKKNPDKQFFEAKESEIPSENEIAKMLEKLDDKIIQAIKNYATLSTHASDSIKNQVKLEYDQALAVLHSIFGKFTDLVLDLILNEIEKRNMQKNTQGGTRNIKPKIIVTPGKVVHNPKIKRKPASQPLNKSNSLHSDTPHKDQDKINADLANAPHPDQSLHSNDPTDKTKDNGGHEGDKNGPQGYNGNNNNNNNNTNKDKNQDKNKNKDNELVKRPEDRIPVRLVIPNPNPSADLPTTFKR
ncbi:hypothetical protein EDEG_03429, partial [Edhazardia aedis USNM 41457]